MKKIAFNQGWTCYQTGKENQRFAVTIPHDAMLLDEKSENSPAGVNTGWYEAQDYTYENTFFIPESFKEERIFFEFEGVYHKATVLINDKEVAYQDYGYIGFYVDPEKFLKYGQDNHMKVTVVNHDQPNSRWYSGTGIYRPVWLYRFPMQHIALDGIRITTLDYQNPKVNVQVTLANEEFSKEKQVPTPVKVEILDQGQVIAEAACEAKGLESELIETEIQLPGAKLWNTKQPYLYQCRVTYGEDVQSVSFGIRVVECNPSVGLQINGKREILRGACIHHDNGLLGACAYDFAEYRKVKLLKQGGYNAIRSAHNPCSKAMLRACDELGVYMMDEYVDVWYIHKTKYDYATKVEANYKEDLRRIVEKDYNHPSVILYSTGNEVAESAQKKGIELCGELTKTLNQLDPSRPVTCGINIFFNFLSSMGFGVYSDKKAEQAVKDVKKKKAVGSEFYNTLAGLLGDNFMKFGATLYPCDLKTRDSFANMNVAGYNYGIFRYLHDLKKYPKRIILGSETFCSDAYRFWEAAKENSRLIGDFVWAGMDYLGEVGIGAWEYKEYAPRFDNGNGWVSAGSGRIDLTGKELGEMKYTRVAFEIEPIAMGVIPVNTAKESHSPSAWKMTNAMDSWSWSGCEGMETKVEVYARGESVSLYLNGKCVGTKKPKGDCRVIFKVRYEDGELIAISYDKNHQEIARTSLVTAGQETKLTLEPEMTSVIANQDLLYVRLKYTDESGIVKPLCRGDIEVEVENGELLGIGSACPFYTYSYLGNVANTYYGESMAIIRPAKAGKLTIHGKSAYGFAKIDVDVI